MGRWPRDLARDTRCFDIQVREGGKLESAVMIGGTDQGAFEGFGFFAAEHQGEPEIEGALFVAEVEKKATLDFFDDMTRKEVFIAKAI